MFIKISFSKAKNILKPAIFAITYKLGAYEENDDDQTC